MRPDWDSYFMKLHLPSLSATPVTNAFVGCVLVLDKRILTTGFNGSPAGQPHCDEVGHLLVEGHNVAPSMREYASSRLHCTLSLAAAPAMSPFPLHQPAQALINAGIHRLVYAVAYRMDENALEFQSANIEIVHWYSPQTTSCAQSQSE